MRFSSRAGGRIGAAAFGAVAGSLIIFGLDGLTSGNDGTGDNDKAVESTNEFGGGVDTPTSPLSDGGKQNQKKDGKENPETSARVFLAWAPGSLPAGTEEAIESMPEVRDATTVFAGLDWIESSRDAQGKVLERYRDGFAVPFEIAAVEPREYSRFVSASDKSAIRALGNSEAVLAETSRELRGGGAGLRLDLGTRTARITGIVSDLSTNGYEALVASPPPADWERADRFVLAHLRKPEDRAAVTRKIESLMRTGQPLRTRSEGENPFLRYGDAVLPQLLVKDAFGEFEAIDPGTGFIDIDNAWEKRNIRTETVPIIGQVRCHRLLIPQLREALRDVKREGLSHAIHPAQFAGCYSPRYISGDPTGRLSHHTWGIAVDLNQAENPAGAKPNMDARVVDIFEDRWGFTWGGRWIIPDGMHFEWIKFP